MNIADADSAEHGAGSENLVVSPISCAVENRVPGAPRLSGALPVRVQPGSLLHRLCGAEQISGDFFCNYGINPAYEPRFEPAGLRLSARGPDSEARAAELPGHRFFLATLFLPQLSSSPERPHPVVVGFLRAAAAFSEACT